MRVLTRPHPVIATLVVGVVVLVGCQANDGAFSPATATPHDLFRFNSSDAQPTKIVPAATPTCDLACRDKRFMATQAAAAELRRGIAATATAAEKASTQEHVPVELTQAYWDHQAEANATTYAELEEEELGDAAYATELAEQLNIAPVVAECDAAYPDFCVPPIWVYGDLDCDDIDGSWFAVYDPDPHGFDGDFDGIGCEL